MHPYLEFSEATEYDGVYSFCYHFQDAIASTTHRRHLLVYNGIEIIHALIGKHARSTTATRNKLIKLMQEILLSNELR